ncbi:MAG: hypothetical protein ACI9KN_002028 [Gammaproteobacteria bacterium]|jgi:hypothetical protein
MKLHSINHQIVDGENIPVKVDCIYSVKEHDLVDAINEIKQVYQPDFCLLPLSGISGGGGIFQIQNQSSKKIIGIQLSAVSSPLVSRSSQVDITQLGLNEIIIDEQRRQIYAGSAITLEQLNQALGHELGDRFKVLGADITSYTYAQVGATFMTGGMGPQRRYFSDSVVEVALHDGDDIIHIEGDALKDYAGTYGWTGLVAAVCCDYFELPAVEIAFAMPINNSPTELARLLQHFAGLAYLKISGNKVLSQSGGDNLILGIEHITIHAMQAFLQSGDNALTKRARQLQANCEAANADGLIFVNGFSNLPIDDFLLELVDDIDAENFTIAGIALEHTEIFSNPDQMRAVREGVPFAARAFAPKGHFIYKGHTDANIHLNPDCVEQCMDRLWRVNQVYVRAVEQIIASIPAVSGQIIVYGHLNPCGVDPHNRITLACDDELMYQQAIIDIHKRRDEFVRQLKILCDETGSKFIGGEKSAGSEYELFSEFKTPEQAPPILAAKFKRQHATIRNASPLFNWRAIAPYN